MRLNANLGLACSAIPRDILLDNYPENYVFYIFFYIDATRESFINSIQKLSTDIHEFSVKES